MELVFLSPARLRPTEYHDPQAATALRDKIVQERHWTAPPLVHRGCLAILDGHHRHQAAIALDLAQIPCLLVSYQEDDIELGTWQSTSSITPQEVLRVAQTGRLFPFKTTRHRMRPLPLSFAIPLEMLQAVLH